MSNALARARATISASGVTISVISSSAVSVVPGQKSQSPAAPLSAGAGEVLGSAEDPLLVVDPPGEPGHGALTPGILGIPGRFDGSTIPGIGPSPYVP